MTKSETIGTDWKVVILLIILAIVLSIGIGLLFPPVRAAPYVEQGCKTIYRGENYDLSGIYGFSGELGWWKNWYDEGSDTEEPDKIIDLNKVNYHNITIDETWNLGNWYQWDGLNKNNHGNTFVFTVVSPRQNITWKNVSINATPDTTSVPIPSGAPTYTIVVTVTPTPEVTAYFDPNQVLATQIPTETPIMVKKSPINPIVPILAVIGVLFYWRIKNA